MKDILSNQLNMWAFKHLRHIGVEPAKAYAWIADHQNGWGRHWRDDKDVWEDTCPHGVGHEFAGSHGCDGCCKGYYKERKRCVTCNNNLGPRKQKYCGQGCYPKP